MAVTKTPRFQLDQWSEGGDPRPGRVDTNRIHQLIETQAAKVFPSGVLSNRPASNTFGSFFLATDQGVDGRLYYNGGSGWVALNTVGGGGPGRPIVINGVGGEGSSLLAARADHTHAIPLATASRAGAMASQWAELMENATVTATAGTIPIRDSGGRLTAQRPTSAQHVATKDYVDNAGSGGPFPGLASRNSAGQLSVANPTAGVHAVNKQYVDNLGSTGPHPGIMARNGDGQSSVENPTNGLHIANKRYVDTRASRTVWKTNIEPLDDVLDDLCEVNVVRYDYKDDAPDTGHGIHGALVEQVARHLPNLTITGDDGKPERIKDREMLWVVLKGLQESVSRINALEEELDNLYTRIDGESDA